MNWSDYAEKRADVNDPPVSVRQGGWASYAPGQFDGARNSLSKAREIVGHDFMYRHQRNHDRLAWLGGLAAKMLKPNEKNPYRVADIRGHGIKGVPEDRGMLGVYAAQKPDER